MTLTGVGVGFAIEWYLRVLIVAIYMILGAAKLPLELLLCSPLPFLVNKITLWFLRCLGQDYSLIR